MATPDPSMVTDYIRNIVDPTIEDLKSHPTSRRHGFLACVVTFHIVDYIDGTRATALKHREKFCRDCKEFLIVDQISHAFKHFSNKSIKFGAQPMDADDLRIRHPAKWGQGQYGQSRWGDSAGGLTVDGNTEVDVLLTVLAALEFIRQQLDLSR